MLAILTNAFVGVLLVGSSLSPVKSTTSEIASAFTLAMKGHYENQRATARREAKSMFPGSRPPSEELRQSWRRSLDASIESAGSTMSFLQVGDDYGQYGGDQMDDSRGQQGTPANDASTQALLNALDGFTKVPVSWMADPRYQTQRHRAMTGLEESKLLTFMVNRYNARGSRIVDTITDHSTLATDLMGRGPNTRLDQSGGQSSSLQQHGGGVSGDGSSKKWSTPEILKLLNQAPLTDIELAYGCDKVQYNYLETCRAYASYLENCPAMKTNICHVDQGGKEQLFSPCPPTFIGFFCLRTNPTYALAITA
eukprot:g4092.t1